MDTKNTAVSKQDFRHSIHLLSVAAGNQRAILIHFSRPWAPGGGQMLVGDHQVQWLQATHHQVLI